VCLYLKGLPLTAKKEKKKRRKESLSWLASAPNADKNNNKSATNIARVLILRYTKTTVQAKILSIINYFKIFD
jgi:hypothetical protein